MRKGDEKKLELIQTGERLFCRNGYEQTSVQDIIDLLHTSKGSFYHHFPSKDALLSAICARRAEALARQVIESISGEEDPLVNLNRLFSGMMPLIGERIDFTLMLVPVFDLPEGRSIQNEYCHALADCFRKPLIDQLRAAHEQGLCYSPRPEIQVTICLLLVNDLWRAICGMILESEHQGAMADLSEIMRTVNEYRRAMENVLQAPFGSMELVSLSELKSCSELLHTHWRGSMTR